MITFGIIGGGWRAGFYVRIARLCPEKFKLAGIYIRNSEKAKAMREKEQITVWETLEEIPFSQLDFVVSCVNKNSICDEIVLLAEKGVAVLSETPIGTSLEQIEGFEKKRQNDWRVQVSEQYHLLPKNQVIQEIIDSGILGEVHQVQLSCGHDYHAVSLMRHFLGIGEELPEVQSITLPDRLVRYDGRNGNCEPVEVVGEQKLAVLTYGTKTAIYDFNKEQYFSDIRANRMVIRGTKGEIVNDTCTYLEGTVPITFSLNRIQRGCNENLNGMYLDSITGNGKIWYRNPFAGSRLSDEEIAIATCLVKMKEYVETGKEFYNVREASLDAKTALLGWY